MRVLSDFHHGDLYRSLQMLFEKRLGWELYRPIGMDWFEEGFWKIAEPYGNYIGTVRQFLDPNIGGEYDSGKNLNANYKLEDGIYRVWDPGNESHQRAITLKTFKEMDIDIVISSYGPHDDAYERLIREYKSKAKHVSQVGNIYQGSSVKNVMCSTAPFRTNPDQNIVFYHQEFDLNTFKYVHPGNSSDITSFVNCLPEKEVFDWYKGSLPEFRFRAFGAACPDGTIQSLKSIADIMSNSMFGWHLKPGGDGYGHCAHNWSACGRPVIIKGSQYRGKLAGRLFIHEKTCIDLERYSNQTNAVSAIRYYSEPARHLEMCENMYAKFKEVVDFDAEEIELIKFFERVLG